jgi:ribosomal protein S3
MQEIYEMLWEFFQGECDSREETEKLIRTIDFTEITINTDTLVLKVRRPGMLIGKKGERVEKLRDFLGLKISIEEEEKQLLADRIIPYYLYDYEPEWDGDY